MPLRVERFDRTERPGHRRARRQGPRRPARHRGSDRLTEFVEFGFHPDPFNGRERSLCPEQAIVRPGVSARVLRNAGRPDALMEPHDFFLVKPPVRLVV